MTTTRGSLHEPTIALEQLLRNATVLVQTYHMGVCKVAVRTIPGSIADIKSTVVWIVVGCGSDATLVCGYCWVFRH